MNFKLRVSNNRYSTREPVEYGSWSESNDYTYYSAEIAKEGEYNDVGLFPGEVEPSRGEDIFVVIVEYSSGDSFGSSSGNHEILWAFTDPKKAFSLSDFIEKDYKDNSEYDFSRKPKLFEGVPINTNTWKGYFERMSQVIVEKLMVTR